MIEFTVPGKPVGKGRPKFRRVGAFVQTYTPDKTVSWESLVAMCATQARGDLMPTEKPCSVTLEVEVIPPLSWSKRKREAAMVGLHWPAKKPDLDNILKAVGDALNGVLWVDDAQLVRVEAWKRYGTTDQTRVMIKELA